MSTIKETTGLLKSNLERLILKKDELHSKRFVLQKKIEIEEASKEKVLKNVDDMKRHISELETRIASLASVRNDVDVTLAKTEEAIGQIKANTDVLLAIVNKSDEDLKIIFDA
jgi:chromosome segregation ATPase